MATHPSPPDGLLYQYRAKHEIKDRRQLLGWLARYNQVGCISVFVGMQVLMLCLSVCLCVLP